MIQVSAAGGIRPVSAILVDVYAAHNPVILTADRFDHFFNSTQDFSGSTQINIDTGFGLVNPIPAYGDKIYYKDSTGAGVYTVTFASTTIIIIDKPFTGTDVGYVNCIQTRRGYYIRCQGYVWNGTAYDLIGSSRHHPNTSGTALIDISNYMRKAVSMNDTAYIPTASTFIDPSLAKQIRIELSEVFVGNTPGIDYQFLCGCLNAAQPAGNKELVPAGYFYPQGSTMAQYYTEPSGSDKALFLSSVRKLRYWKGLPFDVGFFYSVLLTTITTTFKRLEELYNFNDSLFATSLIDIPFGNISAQYHFKVHRSGLAATAFGAGAYPSTTKKIKIALIADTVQITEKLEIRIDHCIGNTPVMLKAFDPACGWRYFCFKGKQLRGINTQAIGVFQKWYENISTQKADIEFIGKDVTPELKMGADMLDIYDMQIIEIILGSAVVYMLTNPLTWLVDHGGGVYEGDQWEQVRVKPGSYTTLQSNHVHSSIEFSVEMLKINLPTQ